MKKLIFSAALILSLGLAACGDDSKEVVAPADDESKVVEETKEEATKEDKVQEEVSEVEYTASTVNIGNAQDASVPFADRLATIALELFGDTTIDGKERNITVDSMGEMYYLKMMFDDAITKKGTVDKANRQTIELFKVLKQIDGFDSINVNWQANTSKGELVSAVTVQATKAEIAATDFDKLDPSKLKDNVTNYGLHKDLK